MIAVESLYNDQLKPYSRILLKRLGEHAEALGRAALPIMDAARLREVCESCTWLFVQQENGAEWSALLRYRPTSFVDVYSPQDIYPAELWHAAAHYFENLDDAHMSLPGGRYSCAQALQARALHFLVGRSLGEVCHIVQLGISQKKLLGYLHGAVVPYDRSQSRLKDQCAERQRPCTSEGADHGGLADWETMRKFLRETMSRLTPGIDTIPLSNMKRLFRSRFHKELSETALGHAKPSELLQDPRLQDLCTVRLQGHNYVVTPVAPLECKLSIAASLDNGAPNKELNIAESLPKTNLSAAPEKLERSTLRERAKQITPLSLDDALPAPPLALPPCLPPVADVPPPPSGLAAEQRPTGARSILQDTAVAVQTPSPSCTWHSRCLRKEYDHWNKGTGGVAGEGAVAEVEVSWQDMPEFPVLTPCTLGSLGFKVSNTFIQASLPPPTPLCGSSRRSRSVPRGTY
jgi:hypothetical protein